MASVRMSSSHKLCSWPAAILSDIFDLQNAPSAGSGYSVFAGREAARALAKMSLREEDCSADLEGLTKREQDTLRDWEERLLDKYSVVGQASALESPVCRQHAPRVTLAHAAAYVVGGHWSLLADAASIEADTCIKLLRSLRSNGDGHRHKREC